MLFDFGKGNGQVADFFWRNDGEVLHILGFAKNYVAIQSKLKEFLNHLNYANAWRDGVSRKVCLVDGPLGMYAELEGREALLFLLREDCKEVIL